jgi:hypothetical protein
MATMEAQGLGGSVYGRDDIENMDPDDMAGKRSSSLKREISMDFFFFTNGILFKKRYSRIKKKGNSIQSYFYNVNMFLFLSFIFIESSFLDLIIICVRLLYKSKCISNVCFAMGCLRFLKKSVLKSIFESKTFQPYSSKTL